MTWTTTFLLTEWHMQTTEKTCFKCGVTKQLSDFYAHKAMADGHLNKCKCCAKQDAHQHRHGNGRERVLASDRKRSQQPNRKELRKVIFERWKDQHPNRRRANVVLGNAIRCGKVMPQPCWVCGQKAEGHHPDYDRPLDVVWLCRAHHMQTHAMFTRLTEHQKATP